MPDLMETVEDGVATLTLNRPESAERAVRWTSASGLLEALERLGATTTPSAASC